MTIVILDETESYAPARFVGLASTPSAARRVIAEDILDRLRTMCGPDAPLTLARYRDARRWYVAEEHLVR